MWIFESGCCVNHSRMLVKLTHCLLVMGAMKETQGKAVCPCLEYVSRERNLSHTKQKSIAKHWTS